MIIIQEDEVEYRVAPATVAGLEPGDLFAVGHIKDPLILISTDREDVAEYGLATYPDAAVALNARTHEIQRVTLESRVVEFFPREHQGAKIQQPMYHFSNIGTGEAFITPDRDYVYIKISESNALRYRPLTPDGYKMMHRISSVHFDECILVDLILVL